MRYPNHWMIVMSMLAACSGSGSEDSQGETHGSEGTSAGSLPTTTTASSGASEPELTSLGSDGTTAMTSATATTSMTSATSATTMTTMTSAADTEDTDTGGEAAPDACAATVLPPRAGATVVVKPVEPGMVEVDGVKSTLRAVVSAAKEGDTIVLEDGTYTLPPAQEGQYTGVYITTANITLRSASGDPSAVIIDAAYRGLGGQSGAITIDAPGVVVADIGVRRSIFHLVHLWANADGAILHNLDLVDGGEQFVKASTGDGAIDGVQVSCSRFMMTEDGRDNVWGYGPKGGATACYTGGIDTHESTNWTVRDNHFEGIYCNSGGVERPAHGQLPEMRGNMTYTGGLAEHGIHMWDSVAGTGHTLTRNRIVNCARGIGLGFVKDVYGATITNNMVFSSFAGSGSHDVGISLERAHDSLVAFNTVYLSSPDSYGSGIEYRWDSTTNLTMHGNMSNRKIRSRDGAVAELVDNLAENAPGAWFVDADAGDLHLADCAGPGEASLHPEVDVDYDDEPRTAPTQPGADYCAG